MNKKYSIDSLVTHYLEDIKALESQISSPADEGKLRAYTQAVKVFKDISIKDIVQFALTYGRNASGKSAQMRNAFPIILCHQVSHPSAIDLSYARLLLEYAKMFKQNTNNIKEWTLRFVLSSRFSPVYGLFEREINNVIKNTEQMIQAFSATIK